MLRLVGVIALFGAAVAANALTIKDDNNIDVTALQINKAGFICSDIVSMQPGLTEQVWNVRCIEFHDGTGRAHFSVDLSSGLVLRTY